MKHNLIKVVNPSVAEKLAALGFSYIKEQVGKKAVFVFTENDGLEKELHRNFSRADYFFERKLRF